MSNKNPIPTNKLTIYMLKDGVSELEDILSTVVPHKDYGINGKLYALPSNAKVPDWTNNFFKLSPEEREKLRIYSASARAILIVENVKGRTFAVTFGYGVHMLNANNIEQRFGLKTTLNIVDQNNIRSIDKTSLESVPKHSKEQLSQDGNKESFGLNIEQDLVRAISGKAKTGVTGFGKSVSGKDALYLSVKCDINNIRDLLERCYERYLSNDYKQNFEWIDLIKPVKDTDLIVKLNEKIIQKITNDDRDRLWVATPEQIDWSENQGFAIKQYRNGNSLEEDLSLSSIIEQIGADRINVESLRHTPVLAISSTTGNVRHTWTAYNCLYAEIDRNDCTYLLTNGSWYEINSAFVSTINGDFLSIPHTTVKFPEYSQEHENEAAYNKSLANVLNGQCLDAQNISYGGGHSKIEFCDVYSGNKEIIHVKHYSGSSTLSHLFSQGVTSAELLKSDSDFRILVNDKLKGSLRIAKPSDRYTPNGQKIIYGIITRATDNFDIPFFSKVSLRNARRILSGLDYTVELAPIKNTSPKKVCND